MVNENDQELQTQQNPNLGANTIVKVAHPGVTNGLELNYKTVGGYTGFDRFGRIIGQTWQNTAGTAKDQFQYTYDANSNRITRDNTQTSGKDEKYAYDGLNRLTSYDRGTLNAGNIQNKVRNQAWGLDQLGNWKDFRLDADGEGDYADTGTEEVDQDRTHNGVNEIYNATPANAITEIASQPSWVSPAYDLAGNMTYGPKAGMGTQTNTEQTGQHLIYDAWNRLIAVWQDDGDGTLETTGAPPDDTLIVTYSYDGRHRRITKDVESPAEDFDYYYNDGWQVLEVREGGDASNPYEQYIYDIRYVHSPVCRFEDHNTDGNNVETLYYANDANFNVTALINTNGTVAERYVYDPYGKVTIYDDDWSDEVSWANSKQNTVLFTGHRYDHETGLYYACNRYYHPTMGRWITPDHIEQYVDGGNLFEYVESAPVVYTDPAGTIKIVPEDTFTKPRYAICTQTWFKHLFYSPGDQSCTDANAPNPTLCIENLKRAALIARTIAGRYAFSYICWYGTMDPGHQRQVEERLKQLSHCGKAIKHTCCPNWPVPPPVRIPLPNAKPDTKPVPIPPDPRIVPVPVEPEPWYRVVRDGINYGGRKVAEAAKATDEFLVEHQTTAIIVGGIIIAADIATLPSGEGTVGVLMIQRAMMAPVPVR